MKMNVSVGVGKINMQAWQALGVRTDGDSMLLNQDTPEQSDKSNK